MLKRFTVLLHTLSECNSLLVSSKVYSSDPRECLCARSKHGKGYLYLSSGPTTCPTCRKNPIKINLRNCQPPPTTKKLHLNRNVIAEVSLENFVRSFLKEKL